MTDPRLVSLIASKALRDALDVADRVLRDEVAQELRPSERRPVYVDLDGEDVMVGAVTMSKPGAGKRAAYVVDESRFAEWVSAMMPDGIVPAVVGWARRELLERARIGGEFTDPDTGEVMTAPWGVEVRDEPGSLPRLSVRPEPESTEALVRAVLSGRVGSLSLEGGSDVHGR